MKLTAQNTIIFTALSASLFVMALFGWGIYQIRHQEIRNIELEMTDMAWRYASQFDAHLHDVERIASATAAYVQVHPQISEAQIYTRLGSSVKQNASIYGAAMAFEPSQYQSKPLFSPYVYRNEEGLRQLDIGSGNEGYDYTQPQWQWWNAPRKAGKALWSEPYFDEGAGNVLMTTYSVPFKRDGVFWGVTTVDIELENLQTTINTHIDQELPFIVVNATGDYVFHPDADKIMKGSITEQAKHLNNSDLKALWQRMSLGESGVMQVSDWNSDETRWVMFAPISSTDWVFVGWVNETQALADSSAYLQGMTVFLLVALLIVVCGIAYLAWLAIKSVSVGEMVATINPLKTDNHESEEGLLGQLNIASILSLLLFLLFTLAWFFLIEQESVNKLTIAAGHRGSESYKIAEAIAKVTPKYHPDIEIEVLETDGSSQNMRLIEKNMVQLATVQADTNMEPSARLIADLYPDAFQLVVRAESGIHSVADLKGHRIALSTKGSGQYKTFWYLANHFGLTEADIEYRSMSSGAANFALLDGAIDAIFRVRAPGSASILQLIEAGKMRLIPINQAEAMQLEQPALEAGVIPTGSYQGYPALPKTNLPTAVVQRLLITNKQLDEDLVNRITGILFERRRDLVNIVPLAGFISAPDENDAFLPIHIGAQSFYDREKPSFLHENAEPIALVLSVAALVVSGLLNLFSNRKKGLVDSYNRDLLELCEAARSSHDPQQLFQIKDQLLDILNKVVLAEAEGDITKDAFESFAFTWKAVNESVRDRLLVDLSHLNVTTESATMHKGKAHDG